MLKKRLIAVLIIKDGLIVQSIGFNRYLPIGKPLYPIQFVSRWDVDEIVVLDISASDENRIIDLDLLREITKKCFIPISVGGGIKSLDHVKEITRAGADKVVLNSFAIESPSIIDKISESFGSQCVTISIDVRKFEDGSYRVFKKSGKENTGLDPFEWAYEAEQRGAGEILINSIDRDGSKEGYDLSLVQKMVDRVSVPVIACGGVGKFSDFSKGITLGRASGVAAGNIFHFVEHSTILAKAQMLDSNIDVRIDSDATYYGRKFDGDGRLLMQDDDALAKISLKSMREELS